MAEKTPKLFSDVGLELCVAFMIVANNAQVLQHSSTVTTQYKFTLVKNATQGVIRLDTAWTEDSSISCARTCLNNYNNCKSFLYNPDTHQCTPGSSFDHTETPPTAEEGELYYHFMCNTSNGFTIESSNGVQACVRRIVEYVPYQDAGTRCQNLGGYLMSVKSMDRLLILNKLWQANTSIKLWVGCDDLETEGTYVWSDDGGSFTNATIPEMFAPGEPNNYDGNEDCVSCCAKGKLNDHYCSLLFSYVCEMPI